MTKDALLTPITFKDFRSSIPGAREEDQTHISHCNHNVTMLPLRSPVVCFYMTNSKFSFFQAGDRLRKVTVSSSSVAPFLLLSGGSMEGSWEVHRYLGGLMLEHAISEGPQA